MNFRLTIGVRLLFFSRVYLRTPTRPLSFYLDVATTPTPHLDHHAIYASLLDAATRPDRLHQIHTQLLVFSLLHNQFIVTKFVNSCCRLGLVGYARQLFDLTPHPNIFLCNAILKVYSQHGCFHETLGMYNRMLVGGTGPDGFTLPLVLKACSGASEVEMGRAVHAQIFRLGFEADMFVQNGLVAMYAKCRKVWWAHLVFEALQERNVVSWTSIISGYAQNGFPLEALQIFSWMRSYEDVRPDFIMLVSILKAYTDIEDLGQGKSVHGYVIKVGLELELDLCITLTAMYAKCGQVLAAKSLFELVSSSPSVILWNAMISGYAKNGYASEAVELFRKMAARGIRPDSITLRSAILACSQVGSLEMAKWMEEYTACSEYKDDVFVNTTLIDMYAKCGNVKSAHRIFESVSEKDTVAWSAIIVGYGLNSCGREAIDLFHKMKSAGVRPNDVTFLGLLLACSHAGLVEEGWNYFHAMRDHGIEPCHQHYACVVDLLARAGFMADAYEFILKMPIEPTVSVWGALLNACKVYGNVELGAYAAERVFSLDPSNAGHYVQLSNLYASAGMWDDAAEVRVLMKERKVMKPIGSSLIEVNGKLQAFRVGDKSHPKSKEIFTMLDELDHRLKEAGFNPDINFVFHDMGSDGVDRSLCNHSERLAIAYGLISTAPGTTLRITNNLRACVNCHSATKLLSIFLRREIVVRDAYCFHHFKDGSCSCGDHW